MADWLPRICEAMCDNGQYGRSDGAFSLRLGVTGLPDCIWKNII